MSNSIKISVPVSRRANKVVKTKEGKEFIIHGVLLAGKFIRFNHAKDTTLPEGVIEGNLYARKYKSTKGEFEELAIYVTNSVAVEEDVEVVEEDSESLGV